MDMLLLVDETKSVFRVYRIEKSRKIYCVTRATHSDLRKQGVLQMYLPARIDVVLVRLLFLFVSFILESGSNLYTLVKLYSLPRSQE